MAIKNIYCLKKFHLELFFRSELAQLESMLRTKAMREREKIDEGF